jgi:diaminohydroxyphosphoribosylaminopyrimidine deaminase/5-amino-6-(5-phosphoribosylamino)uracil reductase
VNVDEHYMRLAIEIAKGNIGQTNPNPVVGAVVVNTHQIVGMGAHLKAGEAHAEVHALDMAKEKAIGATIYLTLEPCSHYGRTPPCAKKVISSGIKKAFIATLDPNPLVAGRGVTMLQEAGIEVEVGLLKQESEKMNEVFTHYITHQTPFVTLKMATTLDGKIATVTGESQWITSEESRADVHLLRHQNDAIIIGVQTVLKDNPALTTRINNGYGKHPIRVILDSSLRTPLDAQIANTSVAPTWIFVNKHVPHETINQFTKSDVRIFQTEDESQVSISAVLQILGNAQVASLLVEGGGEVNASFLEGGFVHKVISYMAPTLIGGNQAPTSFRGKGIEDLAEAVQLYNVEYVPIGRDLKIIGYVSKGVS